MSAAVSRTPHEMEMGIRRNITPSGQVADSNRCFSVKAIGRFFYCSSGTGFVLDSAISIFAGVTSTKSSLPYVNYVVAGGAAAMAIMHLAQLILVPCIVPKKEYEENVDRMQDEMNDLGNNVVGLGKSNADLSETSSRLKNAENDLNNRIQASEKIIADLRTQIAKLSTELEASNKSNSEAVAELSVFKKLYQECKDITLNSGRVLGKMVQQNADLAKGNVELAVNAKQLQEVAQNLAREGQELSSGTQDYHRENETFKRYIATLELAARSNDDYMARVKTMLDAVLSKLSAEENQIIQLQVQSEASEKRVQSQIEQMKQLIAEVAKLAPQFRPLLEKLAKIEKKTP